MQSQGHTRSTQTELGAIRHYEHYGAVRDQVERLLGVLSKLFFRDYTSVYYDGLEVWADGVSSTSSLGWPWQRRRCGEDSGSMSWDFGAGIHDPTFTSGRVQAAKAHQPGLGR